MSTDTARDAYEAARAAKALADDLDMTRRQEVFHDHPSHPTTCLAYREHYGRRCVCMDYQPPGDDEK
jgi:hypothetical protein